MLATKSAESSCVDRLLLYWLDRETLIRKNSRSELCRELDPIYVLYSESTKETGLSSKYAETNCDGRLYRLIRWEFPPRNKSNSKLCCTICQKYKLKSESTKETGLACKYAEINCADRLL